MREACDKRAKCRFRVFREVKVLSFSYSVFPQQCRQGVDDTGVSLNEATVEVREAKEHLYILRIPRLRLFLDRAYPTRVHLDAFAVDENRRTGLDDNVRRPTELIV